VARVLVVEDNPVTRKMFRVTLEKAGYQVVECATGANALTSAFEARPDLVVTDLQLLDMDGTELVRRLRDEPRCADVPIIAVSGSLSRIEEVRRGEFERTVAFLPKPVEPDKLVAEVRARLGA